MLSFSALIPSSSYPYIMHIVKHDMFSKNNINLIALALQKLRGSERKGSAFYDNPFLRHVPLADL